LYVISSHREIIAFFMATTPQGSECVFDVSQSFGRLPTVVGNWTPCLTGGSMMCRVSHHGDTPEFRLLLPIEQLSLQGRL